MDMDYELKVEMERDALAARVQKLEAALRDIDYYTTKGWAYGERFKAIRASVERVLDCKHA